MLSGKKLIRTPGGCLQQGVVFPTQKLPISEIFSRLRGFAPETRMRRTTAAVHPGPTPPFDPAWRPGLDQRWRLGDDEADQALAVAVGQLEEGHFDFSRQFGRASAPMMPRSGAGYYSRTEHRHLVGIRSYTLGQRAIPRGLSRTTSLAGLSSRTPLNDGWRSNPYTVHSRNSTSHTSFGRAQRTPFSAPDGSGLPNADFDAWSFLTASRSERESLWDHPVATRPA